VALDDRAPTVVFNLEQSTEANHEPGYSTQEVLVDGHMNYVDDPIHAIVANPDARIPEVHVFYISGEALGSLSIFSLESEINVTRLGKHISSRVVFAKEIVIG